MNQAKKDDKEKPDYTLIPPRALLEVVRTFDFGQEKYGDFNYYGLSQRRTLAAAYRHLEAYRMGTDIDLDSKDKKLYHLACAAAELLITLENYLTHPETDNRHKF